MWTGRFRSSCGSTAAGSSAAEEELAGYFKLVASYGYVVVGPHSLAPEHRYPTPPRQMMRALEYVQANAERLQIDTERIALGATPPERRSPPRSVRS